MYDRLSCAGHPFGHNHSIRLVSFMLRNTLTAMAVCALTACSTSKYIPLTPAAKSSLSSIEVRGWLPQDEVQVVAKNPGVSAAMGGGLIGAVIDSQIARARQADIHAITTPFYASVDDVDFRSTFWSAMSAQLHDSFSNQIQAIKTKPAETDLRDARLALQSLSSSQGMLILNTRYAFTEDHSHLISSTSVDLYRGGGSTPIFSNVYHVKSKSPGVFHISAWSAHDGQAYRQAVREAASATADMLALDLTHPRIEGVDKGVNPELGKMSNVGHNALWLINPLPHSHVSGPVLDLKPDRYVIRDPDGRLWSFPR